LIIFDANVLLYAYNSRSESHLVCRTFLEETLSRDDSVAFCWQSILAFLRIGTNPRAFPSPLSRREAREIVSFWLAHPSVVLIEPGERFWEILSNLIDTAEVSGPLMTDASLAALAIEHGATVCTTDRDFTRFPGLKTVDPTSDPN
jgi:toxin-antitoxin system PIN domain toxin